MRGYTDEFYWKGQSDTITGRPLIFIWVDWPKPARLRLRNAKEVIVIKVESHRYDGKENFIYKLSSLSSKFNKLCKKENQHQP